MANFDKAYNITNKHEGFYANVDWDPGKETYMGISRRYHPKWSGWALIDNYKRTNGQPKWNQNLSNIPGLHAAHKSYSKSVFWNPIKGDDIFNQDFANLFYDVYWGFPGIIRPLQGWLGVAQDGRVGPLTIAAINTNPKLNEIYKKMYDWRFDRMKASSVWPQAQQGWTNRVVSFPSDINKFDTYATSKSDNKAQTAGLFILAIFLFSKIIN